MGQGKNNIFRNVECTASESRAMRYTSVLGKQIFASDPLLAFWGNESKIELLVDGDEEKVKHGKNQKAGSHLLKKGIFPALIKVGIASVIDAEK
ncbi:hypothetical protein O9992_19395 [Vibrio lentus]|nr:hypothetical protein [Vibrio lentus]